MVNKTIKILMVGFLCLRSFSFADKIDLPNEAVEYETMLQSDINELVDDSFTYTQIYQIVKTCVINEFSSSVLRYTYYRFYYTLFPNAGGLEPVEISPPSSENETAKIVLFLHGTGGHPATFIPISASLYDAGISNLFTVILSPTKDDPVPTISIENRIEDLTAQFLDLGYKDVDFALIGHSLGAIASAKMAFITPSIEHAKISILISLAGRLKYIPGGDFDWFCAAEKEDIIKIYDAYTADPNKTDLYTIIGSNDEIVPLESTHIQKNEEQQCTIEEWGHAGILFAPETINNITSWIKDWFENSKSSSSLEVS